MSLVKFQRRIPRSLLANMPMFDDMETRMQRLFDDTLANTAMPNMIGWLPPTEIVEKEHELILSAELPGVELKDIDLSVDDGILTIRGEKAEERKEGDEARNYHLVERSYGTFQRSFNLPRTIDTAKIQAEFDKGILKIHMPKTPEAIAKGRKIEIAAKK